MLPLRMGRCRYVACLGARRQHLVSTCLAGGPSMESNWSWRISSENRVFQTCSFSFGRATKKTGSAFFYHRYAIQNAIQKDDMEKANELFWEMIDSSRDESNLDPSVLRELLNGWSRRLHGDKARRVEAVERMDSILRRIVHLRDENLLEEDFEPTLDLYNQVLFAWSQGVHANSVENVQRISQTMKERGMHVDEASHVSILKAIIKSGDLDLADEYYYSVPYRRRDVRLSGLILNGWAKARGAEEAQARLQRLIAAGDANTVLCTIVLSSWRRHQDPTSAENLLKYMCRNPRLQPDRKAYLEVLNAWVDVSPTTFSAPERAESILTRMIADSKRLSNPSLEPDAKAFEKVIICWLTSKYDMGLQRAEQILLKLVREFENQGKQDHLLPTLAASKGVIKAWCDMGNAQAADSVLNAVPLKSVDADCFIMVLDAWEDELHSRASRHAQLQIQAILRKVLRFENEGWLPMSKRIRRVIIGYCQRHSVL